MASRHRQRYPTANSPHSPQSHDTVKCTVCPRGEWELPEPLEEAVRLKDGQDHPFRYENGKRLVRWAKFLFDVKEHAQSEDHLLNADRAENRRRSQQSEKTVIAKKMARKVLHLIHEGHSFRLELKRIKLVIALAIRKSGACNCLRP